MAKPLLIASFAAIGILLQLSLAGCSSSRRPFVYVEPSYAYTQSEGRVTLDEPDRRESAMAGAQVVRGE